MTTVRLILGDQLNAAHSWFREARPDVCYLMMEIRSETDYVRHHAQKVIALFAAMRAFADALRLAGHRVHYYRIGDTANRQTFADNIRETVRTCSADRWERMEADEWRVEQALDEVASALGIPCRVVDAEHFLVGRAEVSRQFAERVPRMEYFYRGLRKKLGLLIDPSGQPHGGRWNFDEENRARWPGTPAAPDWPWQAHDLRAIWQEIQHAGVATMGDPNPDQVRWPITRKEARAGLVAFIRHSLPEFGRFQDAMSAHAPLLFHSALSFALNTKMLHPREVVDAAIGAWEEGTAPLAAVEGFIRQIIGWREFVRAVYWACMPAYSSVNALGASRPLPEWYWTAKTNMHCLRAAISQSLSLAYAHHIQRLMITGNFALLAGIAPDEVDAWYLGIYIDAFEWVELPNTRGMSQFADGGVLASKPYAAGANYIRKQSDYCHTCQYDARRRHGTGACPFNVLYWDFIDRHGETLGRNPRMALPYRNWALVNADEKQAIRVTAKQYLSQLDSL
ncbi:MAG: cryptochrome/photolyase family protein [Burkholderiales bacterium]|nr:cryptochrome/photolyase family protein [Burkholderiales bacterium]